MAEKFLTPLRGGDPSDTGAPLEPVDPDAFDEEEQAREEASRPETD